MIAFYLGFHANRVDPAAARTADIDDGDPELGEFPPWSWWPLVLRLRPPRRSSIGLAIGAWWLFIIASVLGVVALVGWVYEYYRGYFAR